MISSTVKKIWRSTTENAIWIFYAINTLFSVTGTALLYMTIITVVGMIIYYANAFMTLDDAVYTKSEPDSWGLFARKIWRITVANGIWLACGISVIYYLTGPLLQYSLIMTILGFGLFYMYAYETLEYVEIDYSSLPVVSWHIFGQRLWEITEANILTIGGSLSLLLYVTNKALIQTTIFVSIGMVLFYMDAYRAYLVPDYPDAESSHDNSSDTVKPDEE
jgi:hypothetical protein